MHRLPSDKVIQQKFHQTYGKEPNPLEFRQFKQWIVDQVAVGKLLTGPTEKPEKKEPGWGWRREKKAEYEGKKIITAPEAKKMGW